MYKRSTNESPNLNRQSDLVFIKKKNRASPHDSIGKTG